MKIELTQQEAVFIIDAIETFEFEHHYLNIWKTHIPKLVLSKMENIIQSSEGKANTAE